MRTLDLDRSPDTERLAEAGLEASVGRVGVSCDHALAETIIDLLWTEA